LVLISRAPMGSWANVPTRTRRSRARWSLHRGCCRDRTIRLRDHLPSMRRRLQEREVIDEVPGMNRAFDLCRGHRVLGHVNRDDPIGARKRGRLRRRPAGHDGEPPVARHLSDRTVAHRVEASDRMERARELFCVSLVELVEVRLNHVGNGARLGLTCRRRHHSTSGRSRSSAKSQLRTCARARWRSTRR